jgi:hypothetical protein
MISLLGVPGYAHPTVTPASQAPRAIASFPCKIFFIQPPPWVGWQDISMVSRFSFPVSRFRFPNWQILHSAIIYATSNHMNWERETRNGKRETQISKGDYESEKENIDRG